MKIISVPPEHIWIEEFCWLKTVLIFLKHIFSTGYGCFKKLKKNLAYFIHYYSFDLFKRSVYEVKFKGKVSASNRK